MAAIALEEKINKIRQQNEEIKRRYEEVEQDKKKAAESNSLVQMVPSTDWPERKEPPEFSNPPRNSHKQKNSVKEHSEQPLQHQVEGRKGHSFAQGEGPPPDPKYNFLADSDREEFSTEYTRESSGGRGRSRPSRGNIRRRAGGRDGPQKDGRMQNMGYRDGYQPEYDAWRAERNRIDEDRISRQRTAEGNWRREWDNNKMHVADDVSKRESRATFGDAIKRDKHFDNRHHSDGHEHMNYNRGGNQRGRGSQRGFHNHEHRYSNSYDQHGRNAQISVKNASHYLPVEDRTVTATDKNIKVTLNQSAGVTKGPVTSVKVNSPNIAGTGRVGPRQRTRVTYSSHSDFETNMQRDTQSFARQKSFEDKPKAVHYNNAQKVSNLKRTPSQKKKESKSPYTQRKEYQKEQPKEQREDSEPSHRRTSSDSSAKQIADLTIENVSEDTNASEKVTEVISTDLQSDRLDLKDAGSPNEIDNECTISKNHQNASEEREDMKIVAINENVPSGKEENEEYVGSDDKECVAQSELDHSNPSADKTNLDLSVNAEEEQIQVLERNIETVISTEIVENVDESTKDKVEDENLTVDETTGNERTTSPIKNSLFTIVPSQENHSESHNIDNVGTDKQIDDNDDIKDDCKEKKLDNIPLDNCDNIKHETVDAELCKRDNNQVSDDNTVKENLDFQECTDLEKVSSSMIDNIRVPEVKEDSSYEIPKETVEAKDDIQKLDVTENSRNEISKEIVEAKDDIQKLEVTENSSCEISKEVVEAKDDIEKLEVKENLSSEVPKEIVEAKDDIQKLEVKENSSSEISKEVVEAKDDIQKPELKNDTSIDISKEIVEMTNDTPKPEFKENSSSEVPKEIVESIDTIQVSEVEKELRVEIQPGIVEVKDNVDVPKEEEEPSNEIPNETVEVKDTAVKVSNVQEESSNEINVAEGDKKNAESLTQSTENNETRDIPTVFPAAEVKPQDEVKESSTIDNAVEQTVDKNAQA